MPKFPDFLANFHCWVKFTGYEAAWRHFYGGFRPAWRVLDERTKESSDFLREISDLSGDWKTQERRIRGLCAETKNWFYKFSWISLVFSRSGKIFSTCTGLPWFLKNFYPNMQKCRNRENPKKARIFATFMPTVRGQCYLRCIPNVTYYRAMEKRHGKLANFLL